MKIPVIKKLVEEHDIDVLRDAEQALYDEQPLPIEVKGEDEGEQLTHLIAAVWIKEHMEETGEDVKKALRAYTLKVRNSIS